MPPLQVGVEWARMIIVNQYIVRCSHHIPLWKYLNNYPARGVALIGCPSGSIFLDQGCEMIPHFRRPNYLQCNNSLRDRIIPYTNNALWYGNGTRTRNRERRNDGQTLRKWESCDSRQSHKERHYQTYPKKRWETYWEQITKRFGVDERKRGGPKRGGK